MIIAFEGPDKAGKTTLMTEFRQWEPYSRWPLFKMDVPQSVLADADGDRLERLSKAWFEGLQGFKRTVSFLLDRCYVTSYVYSRVFRRKFDLSYLTDVARILDPIVVYVRTPVDVLLERYRREGDRLLHDEARLLAVAAEYETWAYRNPFLNRLIIVEPKGTSVENAIGLADAIDHGKWQR